jgi:hypothetical protein
MLTITKDLTAKDDPNGGECESCDNWTERRCSYCHKDWFCSPSCEKQASVYHRFICGRREIITADYLEEAVISDELPDDPQTREDYGFSRCEKLEEESHLGGLYTGLFKVLDVSSEELDQWRKSGVLTENIISK